MVTPIGNKESAAAAIEKFADLQGLEEKDCLALNIPTGPESHCNALQKALSAEDGGYFSLDDDRRLKSFFTEEFRQVLLKEEGRFALRERALSIARDYLQQDCEATKKIQLLNNLSKGSIASDQSPVLTALKNGLGDPGPQVRTAAANAIARIAPQAGDLHQYLIIAITEEPDMEAQCAAIRALGAIGGEKKSVLLYEGLSKSSLNEIISSLYSMAKGGPEERRAAAIAALGQIAKSEHGSQWTVCGMNLAEQLEKLTHDASTLVKVEATIALGLVKPQTLENEALVAQLKVYLGDYNEEVREKTAEALGMVEGKQEEAIEILVKLFEDPSDKVRVQAQRSVDILVNKTMSQGS